MKKHNPAICYEGGLDEACLVGTKEELTAFAKNILSSLKETGKSVEYEEISAIHIPISLTETMCEVVLDGLVIVKDENDKYDLINYVRRLNGEQPIVW
jgi:hypothetical protein